MLKRYRFLLVAILGGVGGLILRSWQLKTAFEPITGLPIPSAPSTIAISLLSLLVLSLLAFMGFSLRRETQGEHQETGRDEPSRGSFVVLLVTCLAAGATLVSAYGFFQEAKLLSQLREVNQREASPFLIYLFTAMCIFAAIGILLVAFRRYQKKAQDNSLALLLPAFAACLWLMVSYQRLAGDPFVMDYLFLLFAIMSGMLAHYFIASHSFQQARNTSIYITAGVAIYFSLTTLASAPLSPHGFLCIAQVLYFAPTLLLLSRNDPSMQPVKDDAQEETISIGDAQYHPLKEETP